MTPRRPTPEWRNAEYTRPGLYPLFMVCRRIGYRRGKPLYRVSLPTGSADFSLWDFWREVSP